MRPAPLDDTASRELSVALYGRIANLEAEASRALGLALLPGHATSRNGLLVPARGEWVPLALPWMPAAERIHYRAGADERRHAVGDRAARAGRVARRGAAAHPGISAPCRGTSSR